MSSLGWIYLDCFHSLLFLALVSSLPHAAALRITNHLLSTNLCTGQWTAYVGELQVQAWHETMTCCLVLWAEGSGGVGARGAAVPSLLSV